MLSKFLEPHAPICESLFFKPQFSSIFPANKCRKILLCKQHGKKSCFIIIYLVCLLEEFSIKLSINMLRSFFYIFIYSLDMDNKLRFTFHLVIAVVNSFNIFFRVNVCMAQRWANFLARGMNALTFQELADSQCPKYGF